MDPASEAALQNVKNIGNYEVWYVRYILYSVLKEDLHEEFLKALVETGEGSTEEFRAMYKKACVEDPDEVVIVIDSAGDEMRQGISAIANQVQMQVFPANIAVVNQQVVVGNNPRAQLLVQKIAENYLAKQHKVEDASSFDELKMDNLYINAASALACRAAQCQGINAILALRLRDTIPNLKEVYLCCITKPLGHVFVMVKTNDDEYFYADCWTLPVGVIKVTGETYVKIVNHLAQSVAIGKVKGGHNKIVEKLRIQCLQFLEWDSTTCKGDPKKLTTDRRCVPDAWIYEALNDDFIQDFAMTTVDLKKYNKYVKTARAGGYASKDEALKAKRACYHKQTVSDMPQLPRWTAEDVVNGLRKLKIPKKKVRVRGSSVDSLDDGLYDIMDDGAHELSLNIDLSDRRSSSSHQRNKRNYYFKHACTEDKTLSFLKKDVDDGEKLIESLEQQLNDLQIQVEERKKIVAKKSAEIRNRRKFLERKEQNKKTAVYNSSRKYGSTVRKDYTTPVNANNVEFWT